MPSVVDNWIDVIRGFHPLYALTKSVRVHSASESNAKVGRVGKLDSNGLWTAGPGTGSEVPMIILPENTVGQGWQSSDLFYTGLPEGMRHVLVGLAGYECQTTEYDTAQTYNVNSVLTATANGLLTTAGAAMHSSWVCGIVSYAQ
ncbi:MAG: hypothetical protein QW727_04395, partial [Candidatus Pacearchaeota archaeon]